MRDDNSFQLHIDYFNFEYKIQQQLEVYLFENIRLLKKSGVVNNILNNADTININIHIYFFNTSFHIIP